MAFSCKKDATPKENEEQVDVVAAEQMNTNQEVEVAPPGSSLPPPPKPGQADGSTVTPPPPEPVQVDDSKLPSSPIQVGDDSSPPPPPHPSMIKKYDVTVFEENSSAFTEGMTWVYRYVKYSDGKVKNSVVETEKITKVDGDVIFVNDLKKWKVKAGRVYELQPSRGGASIESLKYFEPQSDKEEFRTMIGGDAVTMATISKIPGAVETKAGTFENCLLLETGIDEKVYFSPQVGIIKRETGKPNSKYYVVQELISFYKR